jgi:heme/copper-type cytochrome/quinol oxidase subunit 4
MGGNANSKQTGHSNKERSSFKGFVFAVVLVVVAAAAAATTVVDPGGVAIVVEFEDDDGVPVL